MILGIHIPDGKAPLVKDSRKGGDQYPFYVRFQRVLRREGIAEKKDVPPENVERIFDLLGGILSENKLLLIEVFRYDVPDLLRRLPAEQEDGY